MRCRECCAEPSDKVTNAREHCKGCVRQGTCKGKVPNLSEAPVNAVLIWAQILGCPEGAFQRQPHAQLLQPPRSTFALKF
eukprot:3183329-Amphidinium_carterae.1